MVKFKIKNGLSPVIIQPILASNINVPTYNTWLNQTSIVCLAEAILLAKSLDWDCHADSPVVLYFYLFMKSWKVILYKILTQQYMQ